MFRSTSLLLLCTIASAGAPAEQDVKAAIESTLVMVRAVPGEFAADALLRIAALDTLDTSRRVALLEEAFHRAAEAQQPYKRLNAMPQLSSNAGFQQRAFAQNIDALSLRTRAVEAMLPLNPARARQLFLAIPPLDLPLVSCQDVLVFDVSSYYRALSQVALHTFSDTEVRDGSALQLVRQRVALLSSPAEIAPAARVLTESGLDDAQFAGALTTFIASLKKILGDDRSFTFYLPQAGAAMQTLIAEIERRGASPLQAIEAYRLYLIANFAAARCADDDVMEGSNGSDAAGWLDARSTAAIRFFNQNIRRAPLQPIQLSEAAATSQVGVASGLRSCESPECSTISRQYRALIVTAEGSPRPNSAQASKEWQDGFAEALAALRGWADGAPGFAAEQTAQEFREKCALYMDMAILPQDLNLRQTALRELLAYLQRNRAHARTRLEWLLPVNLLIGRLGLDPVGAGRLVEEFRRSGDPVMSLYAQLESVAPRSAQSVFALM